MPQATWVLGNESHAGLSERGNALIDPTPVASANGACVGNNVLEMRQGMLDEDLSGTGFTGTVVWIGRFVTNEGVEETWAAANNGGVAALARKVASAWSPVAFSDVPNASNLIFMQGVGMNGKFFLAYDSDVNRLHVWDGTQVRRVGLVAGIGASGTTDRRRWRDDHALVSAAPCRDRGRRHTRRSEPSPSVDRHRQARHRGDQGGAGE